MLANKLLVIQINQPTRCNSFTSLLIDVYVWLNMFQAPLRPSSGAYNSTRSLWFYSWRVEVRALFVEDWQVMRNGVSLLTDIVFYVVVYLQASRRNLLPPSSG
jgi:hypothetical protein